LHERDLHDVLRFLAAARYQAEGSEQPRMLLSEEILEAARGVLERGHLLAVRGNRMKRNAHRPPERHRGCPRLQHDGSFRVSSAIADQRRDDGSSSGHPSSSWSSLDSTLE